ncbi:MAG TPA: preprotein translocase subunit SecG [Bryobacteraceae bacterium]|nr:preprotein translocase subunit SecG [Bryobacteraceae bacterium]
MTILVTIVHVLICFFLIVVVLLQSGQAADLAGAFGGMGSQTAFGPRGSATLLSKATWVASAMFLVTSLTLSILATRGATSTGSILEKVKPSATQTTPAKPVAPGLPVPAPIQKQTAPANKK